jgi:glycine cleavage system H protein
VSDYLVATSDKFTFRVAVGRLYSSEGAWAVQIQAETAKRVRVGLTDFVQQRAGDVAFLSVKAPGNRLQAGDELAEMETVKVNLSIHAPVGGTIVEVNPALHLTPEVVNKDPYGEGWLAVIEVASWEQESAKLLDAQAYLSVMQLQIEQEVESR